MITDFITLAGFILTVFVTGVAVGRFIEKIDRFINKNDDKEHVSAQKNNHHSAYFFL